MSSVYAGTNAALPLALVPGVLLFRRVSAWPLHEQSSQAAAARKVCQLPNSTSVTQDIFEAHNISVPSTWFEVVDVLRALGGEHGEAFPGLDPEGLLEYGFCFSNRPQCGLQQFISYVSTARTAVAD